MSIIISIFQALFQAITWIFPVSESGHSAIFHDLAGRYTNACSQLTGVVHIGIAVGIFIAFFKLFKGLFKSFFLGWNDLFHKRLDVKNASSQRKFMFMTIFSFVFFIFYLIPAGSYGNVFQMFHRTSYNGNLLGEGICLALTGALIIVISELAGKLPKKKMPQLLQAGVIGLVAFLALPFAGCSFTFGIFAAAMLMGMSEKYALRYSAVMSVPVLITAGIIELCTAVTPVGIAAGIIGFILAAAASFFAVKLFIFVLKNKALKYFAFYDIAIGLIALVIGIFEIVIKS